MTEVVVDSRVHADALLAAVDAQLGPNNAYKFGEVPGLDGVAGVLPNIFVVMTVQRRPSSNLRSTAQAGSSGWRASFRSNGRTADECWWAMNKVALAVNEVVLTIDGTKTTPIQFESDQAPRLKDGRQSALSTYTYAH